MAESGKMNKEAYIRMIEEDIDSVISIMPKSMERDHVVAILKDSVNFYYPEVDEQLKQQKP